MKLKELMNYLDNDSDYVIWDHKKQLTYIPKKGYLVDPEIAFGTRAEIEEALSDDDLEDYDVLSIGLDQASQNLIQIIVKAEKPE